MATGGKTGPTATGGLVPGSQEWWAAIFRQTGFNPYAPQPPTPNPYQPQADALNSQLATNAYNIEHGPGGLDTQETSARTGYGFLGGDPKDPYSRAAALQKSYENNVRGSTNSYASRGQLYAGSLVNAQNANTSNYNQSFAQGQRAEQGLLDSIAFRRQQAKDANATGRITNSTNALNQAIGSPPPEINLPDQTLAPANYTPPGAPRPPAIRSISRRRTRHTRRY